jgi:hypothetical protein
MPPKAEWLRVGQCGKRRRCALAMMRGFSAITIIPGNNIPTGELQKKIVAGVEAPATFRLK